MKRFLKCKITTKQEVDFCMSLTPPDLFANKTFDYSYPVQFVGTTIVIPFPVMSGRLSYLAKPFQIKVKRFGFNYSCY